MLVLTSVVRTEQTNGLQRVVEAEVARMPARVGLYAKHLPSGETVAVRPDEIFSSQSTRKVPIMVMAFQAAEQGRLNLTEPVRVQRSDFRNGTGVLQYHEPGMTVTMRDLITEMIITSDNTATNLVIAKLGGPARVNQWLADQKYVTRTKWGSLEGQRKTFSLLGPPLDNLTDEEVTALEYLRTGNSMFDLYADVFAGPRRALVEAVTKNAASIAESIRVRDPDDEDYWTGRTTPREMGVFLEAIERGASVSPKRSKEMKDILLRQQLGVRRIPHYLTVPVAHKTGDGPTTANDVGIVDARSGPIVISLFAVAISGPYGETEDQIGRIARLIVEHFDGAAGKRPPQKLP
jgi:beta-lactamase class A